MAPKAWNQELVQALRAKVDSTIFVVGIFWAPWVVGDLVMDPIGLDFGVSKRLGKFGQKIKASME